MIDNAKISNKLLVLFSGADRDVTVVDEKTKQTRTVNELSTEYQLSKSHPYRQINWSHSLVKQMIAYAFMTNTKGRTLVFNELDLADAIGVSPSTIARNNDVLNLDSFFYIISII